MKRHRPSGEEEEGTNEKQPRKPKNIHVSAVNFAPATLSPNVATNVGDSKERISDNETNGELPSLNESLENNVASTSSDFENKRVTDLEVENIKLKSQLSYFKAKQEKLDKKGNTLVKSAYAETKQHFHRAKDAKIKADELEKKLLQCQDIIRTKESQRMQLQHQLNQAEQNLMAKDEEIKKIINNGGKKIDQQASILDLNLENEFRQMIAVKDITINGLHQKLEQAYKNLENQKDETREIESEIKRLRSRTAELIEAAKTTKEKEDAYEKQIEDMHNELGQRKMDCDQLRHDNEYDHTIFEEKLKQNREAIEQKNQEIAELRKKLDIQEVYDEQVSSRIDVTESKAKNLENQYVQTRAKLHELQVKYNDLQKQLFDANEENGKILVKKDEKIFELKKDIGLYRKGYRSDKEKYSNATREIEKLKSEKENLRFEILKKEDANGKSQSHLENAHQEIENLKQQLEKTNEQLNIIQTKEEKSAKNASNIVVLLKQIHEIRDSMKEKDLIIADLQKQNDENEILLSQNLNNLAIMEENANKLQRLYDDLWRTKETEKTEIIKEKEDALLQIQELKTEIKCLISQKERYEKELSKTEDYLQATNTELAHERAEHEKAKDVVAKSKEFINNAKLIKDEETLRAEEAIARLATFEVQFLQNQSTLKSEQEQRILLQTQLIAFQQQLTERIDSKEKIIKELETRMSESIAEIANLEKKLKNLQKKYSDVQSQMEDERKKHIILDGEYKRLATSNYEAKNQIEKYKAEISSHQKTVAEKNTELQKLCDESNVVLQKLKDFCKK